MAIAIQATSETSKPFDLPIVLRPEDELLLLCARQELTPASMERLNSVLEQPLQWEDVVHDARWHKLSGFLYEHLRHSPYVERVPEGVLQSLKGDYLRHTARYLYYRTELVRLLRTIHEASIPVIVLKGSALVGLVYSKPGLRPMADIDLLVPDHLVAQAHSLVKAMGYRPGENEQEDPEHWAQHQHLPILLGIDKAVAVEMHRHVVRKDSALAFEIDDFWKRAEPIDVDGVPAQIFAPEDFLLHLAVNFFRDRRFYSLAALSQLTDIAELSRVYGEQGLIDWELLADRARGYRIDGPVACALTLAAHLCDAPIPQEVINSLWRGPLPSRELAAFASERVLGSREWAATELVPAHAEYGFRSLVRSAARRLFPGRAAMTHKYGDASVTTYLRHVGTRLPIFARFLRRPWSIGSELMVDRWLHSLYGKPPSAADLTDD